MQYSLSEELNRFWSRLDDLINTTNRNNNNNSNNTTQLTNYLNINDDKIRKLWFQCWSAAANGAKGPLTVLPTALLILPDVDKAIPSPLYVSEVLLRILTDLKPNINKKSIWNILYYILEIILNVIRNRLRGHIQSINRYEIDIQVVIIIMTELRDNMKSVVLKILELTDDDRFPLLLSRSRKDIEDYQSALVSLPVPTQSGHADGHEASDSALIVNDRHTDGDANSGWKATEPWNGWRLKPTVGWLMSRSWHVNVPELKNTWQNSDQYADAMLRIWTLLTFYWGSGAVWPKCTCRNQGQGDESMCGNPLLCATTSEGRCTQRLHNQQCGGKAAWKCLRGGHDQICEKCLYKLQTALIGTPSRYASTDIYDGVVERETTRREGSVYVVNQLESRKPPQVPHCLDTILRAYY